MEEARERFFSHVNKTETCWLWIGSKNLYGYGQFTIKSKPIGPHRFSWLLAGNTIPEGHLIRHKCRNKHCVNPEHLETGTHQENALDRVRDGTNAKGEKQGLSKLTEEQVREIKTYSGDKSYNDLSKDYGVYKSTIEKIVTRKTWKHI